MHAGFSFNGKLHVGSHAAEDGCMGGCPKTEENGGEDDWHSM